MKNLFFTLAFMLMGTFAFANVDAKPSIESTTITKLVEKLTTTYIVEIKNADGTCSIHHYVYRADGSLMGSFTITAPDTHEDCNGVVFHMTNL
ncbi:hypothetical protein ES731_14960 [Psychroflexus gondwanensis]|jgi:hypothetical protein|uniref:Secreted protein n=1 Tax=Psychroflexus gondwanensis ACAM 44 TaxID=1189619 RepID=N1WSK1_9FLAO|nr:hypothetical protein [Psychroflexus gondwanensis]EMY80104.1 hypothetical protein pgond44_13706 [Psychroflexus gondwanensis ACAM 44]TXE15789.1 hypothetical protein ES731_14960 [Psychroflexus gondwanensis]